MLESASGIPGRVLDHVASTIEQRRDATVPFVVAVDGIDAAGKTTFAAAIADALRDRGMPAVRASIDGFHRPATERHRRSEIDPGLSYYADSFDYSALKRELLIPFAEHHPIRAATFDYRSDRPVSSESVMVEEGAVLVFDGVFLQRPELAESWDLVVFLRIDPGIALGRAVERDGEVFGSDVERRYKERYQPGQAIYFEQVDPEPKADIVVDMNGTPFVV